MMTLKHIDSGGREKVVSLASVDYDPEKRIVVGHGVVVDRAEVGDRQWDRGRIFLMNEFGKTISVWTLNR